MGPETAVLFTLASWADLAAWGWRHFLVETVVVLFGMELIGYVACEVPQWFGSGKIEVRGKHLDSLDKTDIAFIAFNRLLTVMFTYHMIWFCTSPDSHVVMDLEGITLLNTVVALPALYVVYDLFYSLFHMALHHRSIYAYVHKHHHKQKAPSRGNTDAVNVHPFEFGVGEYLHLLAVAIVPCHVVTVFIMILVGGILASLNHTRNDIGLPSIMWHVKYHDHHHVYPNCNYSQYSVMWDHAWGSFHPHPSQIPASEKDADKKAA